MTPSASAPAKKLHPCVFCRSARWTRVVSAVGLERPVFWYCIKENEPVFMPNASCVELEEISGGARKAVLDSLERCDGTGFA